MAQHPRATARLAPVAALLLASTAAAGDASLKKGHDAFEYGDFRLAASLLAPVATLATEESDRLEAWRLLGLSHFFLKQPEQAEAAFLSLLKLSPDAALDPFFVPPDAVAFFDSVKERHANELALLRPRPAGPVAPPTSPPCEALPPHVETVTRHNRLVTLLPLGAGQFQNGHVLLGGSMLAAQLAAAATSLVTYWSVEAARGPDGRFSNGLFDAAVRASEVRLWSGGLFYLLWAASTVDANLRFVPIDGDRKSTAP